MSTFPGSRRSMLKSGHMWNFSYTARNYKNFACVIVASENIKDVNALLCFYKKRYIF